MKVNVICDSCGHRRPALTYTLPILVNKDNGVTTRQDKLLCYECALTIAELIEKEVS